MCFKDWASIVEQDYALDYKTNWVLPRADKNIVNYNQLYDTLRSKDLSLMEQDDVKQMFQGKKNFLDGKVDLLTNKIIFNSFPRCGNSFLRKYLELITNVTTTSYMGTKSIELSINGLFGNGTVDDSSWIVKSHWPSWKPPFKTHWGNKQILIVRNPYDVIYSRLN
jgi:hypothetical protein